MDFRYDVVACFGVHTALAYTSRCVSRFAAPHVLVQLTTSTVARAFALRRFWWCGTRAQLLPACAFLLSSPACATALSASAGLQVPNMRAALRKRE